MPGDVTVVSVCRNNAQGLALTLASLARLAQPPREVIVVDGGSTDATLDVLSAYRPRLPMRWTSRPDAGIYDAMNRGRESVRTPWVHYLNGGDEVHGEPYAQVTGPCRLPVRITDPLTGRSWLDAVKLAGYGYCHQGLVLPGTHRPYDLRYRIAADIDLIVALFPQGLQGLPLIQTGGVNYPLGGESSQQLSRLHDEIRQIFRAHPSSLVRWRVHGLLLAKSMLPRPWRRALAALLRPLNGRS